MDLTKSRNLCWQKKNLQQNPHVLDDGASGFASGDVEQVIGKILFKIWYNYIEVMIIYKIIWWWPQVDKEIWKKIQNSPKLDLAISFWTLLLMINFLKISS